MPERPVHPISVLEEAIRSSVFRVAPKKAEEFDRMLAERGVFLNITEEHNSELLHFRAYEDSPEIEVSWLSLEIVWCATYCYCANYAALNSQQSKGEFGFYHDSEELAAAMPLYGWALQRLQHLNHLEPEWLGDAPRPERQPATEIQELTNEIFLVAIAWLLHHECGHQLLQRPKPLDRQTIDLEWEADRRANFWLLDGVSDDKVLTKILLGISAGIGVLEAVRSGTDFGTHPSGSGVLEPRSPKDPDSHPIPFDRLEAALRQISIDNDHLAYAFALSVLLANWAIRNYDTWVQLKEQSFRELFEDFGLCLAGKTSNAWLRVRPEDAAIVDACLKRGVSDDEIRPIAHGFWEKRGKPIGSPEADWYAALDVFHEARMRFVLYWLQNRNS
jgi:hypothetical protein